MTTAQEQFNGAIREGQDILTQSVRAWQDAVSHAASTMAQNVQQVGSGWQNAAATPQLSTQIVDNVFDFAEQLLSTQRQFAKTLLESSIPAWEAANRSATAAGEAMQKAANDSASAVQSAANKTAESTTRAAKK